MSTTRGVLYVHAAPSALCPHIEWAVGGAFGTPVRLDWTPQPAERAAYRTEYAWTGPAGTAARLTSALKGWQRIRFEATEEASEGVEAHRYSYTPALGVLHTQIGLHGDVVVRDEALVGLLRKWQEESKRERERVGGLVGYSVGVVGWVRSAR